MWDNAPLLRNIANALFLFGALAALYGATYYLVHLPGLLPLRSMRLDTVPQRVEQRQLPQQAVGPRARSFAKRIE